jgi:hypothetical protein
MDLISLIKSNTRVRFDERSESGFSPCGRDRPKGDSEVAVDEESAPKGEQKKAKGAEPLWNPTIWGVFRGLAGDWLLTSWGEMGTLYPILLGNTSHFVNADVFVVIGYFLIFLRLWHE